MMDLAQLLEDGRDPAAEVLIESLITMSKGLDVNLIAEGVETQNQRGMFKEIGCKYVRGFYYGAAVPFEAVYMRLVSERRELTARRASPHHAAV